MDITLIHHFFFFQIAFRQAAFHLFEATVMQHGRVGMDTGDLAISCFGKTNGFFQGPAGIFRSVESNQHTTQLAGSDAKRIVAHFHASRLSLWHHGTIPHFVNRT